MDFLCSGFRSPLSPLFHHSVFDYMCITVMRQRTHTRTEHLFVIWSCIRFKGGVPVNKTGLSPRVVVLLTVPRRFFCCSPSFFVRLCLICDGYVVLISFFCCLGKTVLRDCVIAALKGKNLLTLGANSYLLGQSPFLLEWTHFLNASSEDASIPKTIQNIR